MTAISQYYDSDQKEFVLNQKILAVIGNVTFHPAKYFPLKSVMIIMLFNEIGHFWGVLAHLPLSTINNTFYEK